MDVGVDTEKLPVFLWLCGTGLQIWAKKVLRIDQEIAHAKNLGRLARSRPVWIVLLGFVCFGFCFIGWCVFGLFFSWVPWLVIEGILPAQTLFPEVHDAQLCTPQGHPEQSIQSHQFTSMKSVLITLIGCSPFSWISWIFPVPRPKMTVPILFQIPQLAELWGSSGERLFEGDECAQKCICFLSRFVLSAGLTVMLGCSCVLLEINENCSSETESRFQSFPSALKLLTV